MSFAVPAAIVGAGLLYVSYGSNVRQETRDKVLQDQIDAQSEGEVPYQGAIGHVKSWWGADTRQRFVSVQEDVDTQGAKIFWVDYGNGQRVLQFHDPRVLL